MVNTFTRNSDANQSNNVVVFAEKASRNTTRRFGATVDSGTIKEVPEQYGSSCLWGDRTGCSRREFSDCRTSLHKSTLWRIIKPSANNVTLFRHKCCTIVAYINFADSSSQLLVSLWYCLGKAHLLLLSITKCTKVLLMLLFSGWCKTEPCSVDAKSAIVST